MKDFREELNMKVSETERIIASFLPEDECAQKKIFEAMSYSVLSGGKRLRPLIMREVYDLTAKTVGDSTLQGNRSYEEKILHPFMAALEFIHSYSLVHDDLPAMDNDLLRRGKPTTHAAFGEGLAILAGDGLLNFAFEVASGIELEGESLKTLKRVYESIGILSRNAGVYGMIGGQVIDIDPENDKKADREYLTNLYRLKTGGLIKSAAAIGAVLAGADNDMREKITEYADCLGVAFQVRDDILDMTSTSEVLGKSVGQDEQNNKLTLAALMGLEEAERLVGSLTDRALTILDVVFDCEDAWFLKELTAYLAGRKA